MSGSDSNSESESARDSDSESLPGTVTRRWMPPASESRRNCGARAGPGLPGSHGAGPGPRTVTSDSPDCGSLPASEARSLRVGLAGTARDSLSESLCSDYDDDSHSQPASHCQ
jgi:hypothetical protein